MVHLRDPGRMAQSLEQELELFRRARALLTLPEDLDDLARALGRIAVMLREAEERGQAVDLGDEVVRLVERFRGAMRTLGGAPAQA